MSLLKVVQIRSAVAARAARDLLSLRADDVWLATFPKTGSSWVRTILSILAHGDAAGLADIDRTVPALGAGTLGEPWTADVPRFVKTHQKYRPGWFARPRRTLLVTRDPRDTLASLHHMLSHRTVARFEGSLSDLVRDPRHGVAAYLAHHASWAPRATAVLRYEALREDPTGTLRDTFDALGAPVPDARIAEAVERSSLERMRAREASGGIANQDRFDAGFDFVRRGAERREAERFSEADEAYYQQLRRRAGFELYP